jgi:membrane dipeptidase
VTTGSEGGPGLGGPAGAHACGCAGRWTAPAPRPELRLGRRELLRTAGVALAVVASGCGAVVLPAHREAAQRIAEESTSVDLHSHPGMFSTSPLTLTAQAARMTRGRLKASLFCAVADGPLLGTRRGGALYATREPRPGELPTYTYRSLQSVRAHVDQGTLALIQSPDDLDSTRGRGVPGALLAIEGGDFLEGRIEGVQEAHRLGVRSIQLTHYRVSELGDIQTEPPRHGGLTGFGKDVIREMNRLGMIVDVAHLTLDGVRAAVEVSRAPLLLSHTVLDVPWPRAVSREHARLVGGRGGVVGIFPVNAGYQGFGGYIEHIERMIGAVGVDHVGVGTDMDGISPPSFVSFTDYAEWPSIGAALLARGRSREDVAKVMGGNFLRLFREVAGT